MSLSILTIFKAITGKDWTSKGSVTVALAGKNVTAEEFHCWDTVSKTSLNKLAKLYPGSAFSVNKTCRFWIPE